ncbi:MAG: hypothetical protein LBI34_03120 [Puniceicoccales bacterium]|jgi:hypothetical protein|nr:hypothetical protein [Puniceicoccales bacterium]
MTTHSAPTRQQVVFPRASLAEIGRRSRDRTVGEYIAGTELIYFVKSNTGINAIKATAESASSFAGENARSFNPSKFVKCNDADPGLIDLRFFLKNNFNVPEDVAEKMSAHDFAQTHFLVHSNGSLRDATMSELQHVLWAPENSTEAPENATEITAIIFPGQGIYRCATSDDGNVEELVAHMRQGNYTARDIEIFTSTGKFKIGNEIFKPFIQKFLERFSTFFFSASASIGTALAGQITAASLAAGAITIACPPAFFSLLCLAFGLIVIGALLLFLSSRIENTVSPPAPLPQHGQTV